MNLLMPAFTICCSLTLVTKAGWETLRCWKDDIGYCRKRCLKDERYKLLCEDKLTCCLPGTLPQEPEPWQPRREIITDDEIMESYTEFYPDAITLDDYVTLQLPYRDGLPEAEDNADIETVTSET